MEMYQIRDLLGLGQMRNEEVKYPTTNKARNFAEIRWTWDWRYAVWWKDLN